MADVDRTVASSVTISQFVAVLRQRWHVIAAIVALCLLAAGGLLSSTPPTYSARAVVRVTPLTGTADKDISTITESRIATSTSVARRVRTLLKTDRTPAQLVSHVAVSSPLDSQVLAFEYSASSARKAAAGANAFAEAYLAYRRDTKQGELDKQDARISQQIGEAAVCSRSSTRSCARRASTRTSGPQTETSAPPRSCSCATCVPSSPACGP